MGFIKYRSSPEAEWQEIYSIKGDPGYSPVKGVDYYTEAEKEELINEVQKNLGESIDLSNYYTKTEIDGFLGDIDTLLDDINGESPEAIALVDEINGEVI